ncbi:MAG: UTP--glucose-1-phosphate uridylyltransferase, partial [Candidatus Omnitrophota bacterium]
RSQKDAALGGWNKGRRYDETMLLQKFSEKGFPLMAVVGSLGILSCLLGISTMSLSGAIILLPYLLASIVFITGMYAYDTFVDKDGHLYGMSLRQIFYMLPYVIFVKMLKYGTWKKTITTALLPGKDAPARKEDIKKEEPSVKKDEKSTAKTEPPVEKTEDQVLDGLLNERNIKSTFQDYYRTLVRKYKASKTGQAEEKPLIINDGANNGNFYPSAMLKDDAARSEYMGARECTGIREEMTAEPSDAEYILWMCGLDAGLGSNVKRGSYVKRIWARDVLGAKGTDLGFEKVSIGGQEMFISVAEIKLLRLISEIKRNKYRGTVVFKPTVSSDSRPSYERLLAQTYLPDILNKETNARTYGEVLKDLNVAVEILQGPFYPGIEKETGKFSNNYQGSGSHGELGFSFLRESLEFIPSDKPTIVAFYNGDGTNNMPHHYILEWMIKQNVPLVMISTTKTGIDRKGGQIGVEFLTPDGKMSRVRMLELASAKSNKQQELFEDMGLSKGQAGKQYFNTNIVLINYDLISRINKDLAATVFKDNLPGLYELFAPDLIASVKQGKDKKDYIQLEGPIGTCMINLHNFFATSSDPRVREILAKNNIDKVLRIVNVGVEERSRFFTPIKSASDHWFQAHSDYYSLDPDSWMLKDNIRGAVPPEFDLKDDFYTDVDNVLSAFGKASVAGLSGLTIIGAPVLLKDAKLTGTIEIENKTGEKIDLNAEVVNPDSEFEIKVERGSIGIQDDKLILNNVKLMIGALVKIEDKADRKDGAIVMTRMIIKHIRLAQTGVSISFGTSGWRGKWISVDGKAPEFTIDNIRRAAQGVADYYKEAKLTGAILIGFDPRGHNAEWAKDIASVLSGNGIPVKIVISEPTPTPALAYLASSSNEAISGVINLTASHNKYIDDGFKYSPSHGGAADKSITDAISLAANKASEYSYVEYAEAKTAGAIEELDLQDVLNAYVNGYLIKNFKEIGAWDSIVSYIKEHKDFQVYLDPMQGTSVRYWIVISRALEAETGRKFYKLVHTNNRDNTFMEVDNAPNPTEKASIEDLTAMVQAKTTRIGLATDGDADRFGLIDFGGKEISANEFMGMLVYFLKTTNPKLVEGTRIGKTVATSNFVNAVTEYAGLPLDELSVGFKWFVEGAVKENKDYLVAGEESAHVGVKPFMKQSWDDGIVMDMMVLWMIAATGKSLSAYKAEIEQIIGKQFFYDRKTVKLTDALKSQTETLIKTAKAEQAAKVVIADMSIVKKLQELGISHKVVDVITLDGVKVVFGSGDWFCIRLSGTESSARLYTEVTDHAKQQSFIKMGNDVLGVKDGGANGIGLKRKALNGLSAALRVYLERVQEFGAIVIMFLSSKTRRVPYMNTGINRPMTKDETPAAAAIVNGYSALMKFLKVSPRSSRIKMELTGKFDTMGHNDIALMLDTVQVVRGPPELNSAIQLSVPQRSIKISSLVFILSVLTPDLNFITGKQAPFSTVAEDLEPAGNINDGGDKKKLAFGEAIIDDNGGTQAVVARKNERGIMREPAGLPIQLEVVELLPGQEYYPGTYGPPAQDVIYVESGKIRLGLYDTQKMHAGVDLSAGDLATILTSYRSITAVKRSVVSIVYQTKYLPVVTSASILDYDENRDKTFTPEIIPDSGRDWMAHALILRNNVEFDKYRVITKPEFALGIGTKSPAKGDLGKAHCPTPVEKPRLELIFVARGKVRYSVYTPQGRDVGTFILKAGDRILSLGGHKLDFIGDRNKMLEIAEGPYPG